MNKLNFTSKSNGDILNASEWNAVVSKTDELVLAINDGAGSGSSSGSGEVDTNGVVSVNSKGNTTISSTKHINIEPAYVADGGSGTYGDVQIKPGDDITLESHHRAEDKRDEITIKTSNGQNGASKAPVKLQVIAADMTLSTKGKQVASGSNDSSNVMNVNVTTGNGKGYLKVRAQAIDLRCEEHGGIALQPKGTDGQGNMNKIKFEHGGGDGLEFGTFNTKKTSIFTDEYRFNREGVWKMATRQTEASDKADANDPTTALKYVKQLDDFYDIIDSNDAQCTTKDIIKTAAALNGHGCVHTHITSEGNLEIETSSKFNVRVIDTDSEAMQSSTEVSSLLAEGFYTAEELNTWLGSAVVSDSDSYHSFWVFVSGGSRYYEYEMKKVTPSINIESANKLKLTGELDFGSSFNFGETDNGIEFQLKKTKKDSGTEKQCDELKVRAINDHASYNYTIDGFTADETNHTYNNQGQTFTPGASAIIGSCNVFDIVKFVNWAKATQFGPWSTSITDATPITVDPGQTLAEGSPDPIGRKEDFEGE